MVGEKHRMQKQGEKSWKNDLPIRPAPVGRAGRNEHLSGEYGPIEKRLLSRCLWQRELFFTTMWKTEKHTNQLTLCMQMQGGQIAF